MSIANTVYYYTPQRKTNLEKIKLLTSEKLTDNVVSMDI